MKPTLIHLHGFTVLLLLLVSCAPKTYHFDEGYAFGSSYHITYSAREDLQPGIEDLLARFDTSLSHYIPASTISQFNRWGTEPFDLSKDETMLNVVRRSLEISELSHGAFDITVAPLVNLWGFGWKTDGKPDPARIDSIRRFVGYKLLHLDGTKLCKTDPRVKLDCSALAVGYASDLVATYLKEHGSDDFLVEISGELAMAGKNPKGKTWRIGISKPVDDSTSTNQDLQQMLDLTDCGLATSGNYRSFYVKDGKKFAHTIDPHSGYPVQHSLLSATIVARDAMTADALATACMVMGMDSAVTLLKKVEGTEGYFIYDDNGKGNKVLFTAGMKKMLVKP